MGFRPGRDLWGQCALELLPLLEITAGENSGFFDRRGRGKKIRVVGSGGDSVVMFSRRRLPVRPKFCTATAVFSLFLNQFGGMFFVNRVHFEKQYFL